MAPAIELLFDTSAYSADALQRALYRMADRVSGEITRAGSNYKVLLRSSSPDQVIGEEITAAFSAEVLDAVLRERIREETVLERNAILSLAFSETGLTSDPDE